MSYESIAAAESEQTNPLHDVRRVYENGELSRMVVDFASKPCRTVMTFDGHEVLKQFQTDLIAWYKKERKDRPEITFASDLMDKYLDTTLSRDISALFCDENKIIMFRKEQYEKYVAVMRKNGFPDPSLHLIKTWDKERPFIEELMIMGLFGDFEPCKSFEQTHMVYLQRIMHLNKQMTENIVRRGEENLKGNHAEIVRTRIETWERYMRAYKDEFYEGKKFYEEKYWKDLFSF